MDLYLDVGSTNIKWETEGKTSFSPFPAPLRSDPPYFEVSAEEIAEKVQKIVSDAGADRLFLSVQMHGYVLLREGKRVTEYISWRDRRGEGLAPAFSIGADHGVACKGNLPRLSLQTQTGFDEFCTLGSFLARTLTGVNASHITDAAPSGFYNAVTGAADPVPFRLPRVTDGKIGMSGKTAVYAPLGDQQCAVLGAVSALGSEEPLILNLGTAGQLCCIGAFSEGDFESRPYFGGKSLLTVTGLTGGGAISSLGDEEAFRLLYCAYRGAMERLPARRGILATGGVVKYRPDLVRRLCGALSPSYTLNPDCDALAGLGAYASKVL